LTPDRQSLQCIKTTHPSKDPTSHRKWQARQKSCPTWTNSSPHRRKNLDLGSKS
jgi:hypothetical protein